MKSDQIFFISSEVVGWTYFLCWNISFYPQVYTNFMLKSVAGFSINYLLYNIVGYLCYAIFNCTLYWSKQIRKEYIESEHTQHHDVPVDSNDVAFALHALFATFVLSIQVLIYERGQQKISKFTSSVVIVSALVVLIMAIICAFDVLEWYYFIAATGYIKLGISFIKCFPQAYLNYKRKSTVGFPIAGVALDFIGGVFAIVQQLIYALWYQDNRELFGNIPKFLLAAVSLILDTIFFWQHYVFYLHFYPKGDKDSLPVNSDTAEEKDSLGDLT